MLSQIDDLSQSVFNQVAKYHFNGGSEIFFSMMWTSHITTFASLQPHLIINDPSESFTSLLRNATGQHDLTFTLALTNYLNGSGIPCPGLFADAKYHFDDIIDLTKIDTPGFRSRALCWAATGCPSIGASDGAIEVSIHFNPQG
jgi:hypothetical protein